MPLSQHGGGGGDHPTRARIDDPPSWLESAIQHKAATAARQAEKAGQEAGPKPARGQAKKESKKGSKKQAKRAKRELSEVEQHDASFGELRANIDAINLKATQQVCLSRGTGGHRCNSSASDCANQGWCVHAYKHTHTHNASTAGCSVTWRARHWPSGARRDDAGTAAGTVRVAASGEAV